MTTACSPSSDTAEMAQSQPRCWIIAGPNGAGKTTFALQYLPEVAQCSTFINADLIAAGLSPLEPRRQLVAASKIVLEELRQAAARREDFAFETTLAGRGHLHRVRKLLDGGWRVQLLYLALPSVELSRMRVRERVAHGGHDIPDQDLRRRFPRSLYNLMHIYGPVVTSVRCFMNDAEQPRPIFFLEDGKRSVFDHDNFELLNRMAQS